MCLSPQFQSAKSVLLLFQCNKVPVQHEKKKALEDNCMIEIKYLKGVLLQFPVRLLHADRPPNVLMHEASVADRVCGRARTTCFAANPPVQVMWIGQKYRETSMCCLAPVCVLCVYCYVPSAGPSSLQKMPLRRIPARP